MADNDDRPSRDVSWRQSVTVIGLALALPWMIGVPTYLGWWLDRRFETRPVLLIAGLLLGLFAAGFDIYRLLRRFGQFK